MLLIQRLCRSLNSVELKYAIVGGHAVAFHGAPRGTVDIDFVVHWEIGNLVAAQKVLKQIGLLSRQPLEAEDVYHFRDEYIAKRGLISWKFYNPNDLTENVNIVINYELNLRDIVTLDVGDVEIPVLSLEKLIQMKQASVRQQDIFDLEALLAVQKRKQS